MLFRRSIKYNPYLLSRTNNCCLKESTNILLTSQFGQDIPKFYRNDKSRFITLYMSMPSTPAATNKKSLYEIT